jgi:hypothetical protein
LGQPLEIFEQLGPVAKGRVHCGDNEELEVASAAANTLSKVAADSNLANCHLDFTTKIGNLACNGRGIDDKTVIIEAKRFVTAEFFCVILS